MSTHVSLTVSDEEVAVVSVPIEHRVALAARDGPIVPGLARQIGPLDGLRGLRWFVVALVATLHGIASGIGAVAGGIVAAIPIAIASWAAAIGRGQVVV